MTTSALPSRLRVSLAFLTLYVVWGSTYLAIRWMVEDIPPFVAAAMRHGCAGAVLYAWARFRGAPRPTRAQWRVAAVVGALLLTAGNGLVNWAEVYVPSGLTSLLVASLPLWMVGLDWLRHDGPAPSGRTSAGLVLGTLGIIALVWSAGGIGQATGNTVAVLLGCGALLVASLAWAVGSLYSRRAPRHPHGGLATGMEMLAASALLWPIALVTGDVARFAPAAVSAASWWSLAYLIVFGSILAFSAYTWLLRVTTPAKVSTYAYVNPVVAVALGAMLGGERLTPGILVAAGLVLAAVVLLTLPARGTGGIRR